MRKGSSHPEMTLFYVRNPLECNISVDSSLTCICKGCIAETFPHHLMCYCLSSILYRGSSNVCYLNYTGFDCKRTRNKSVSSIKMYYVTCFVYCFYNTLLVAPYIKNDSLTFCQKSFGKKSAASSIIHNGHIFCIAVF